MLLCFVKMSFTICIVVVFTFSGIYCGHSYGKSTEAGLLARMDLINSLKIAYNLSKPAPTKEEHKAGHEFVRFLGSWRSEEYVEAFYALNKIENANRFLQFLNAILFNANPSLPIWTAAETLSIMIKTKLDPVEMENLRKLAKTKVSEPPRRRGKHPKSVTIIGNDTSLLFVSPKPDYYIEMYNKSEVIHLKRLLESVLSTINDRR